MGKKRGIFAKIGKSLSKLTAKIGKVVGNLPGPLKVLGSLIPGVGTALSAIDSLSTGVTQPSYAQAVEPVETVNNLPMPVAELGGGAMGIGQYIVSGLRPAARAAARGLAGAVSTAGGYGYRRRRRRGISSTEMGKLMFLGQVVGKRSPAMTWAVMRAIGGRI